MFVIFIPIILTYMYYTKDVVQSIVVGIEIIRVIVYTAELINALRFEL